MISQALNSVGNAQLSVATQASAQPSEVQRQKQSAPVELPQQAVQAVEKKLEPAEVKQASEQINEVLRQFERNLQFTVDEDTGIDVVRVIDTETEEVIRQFPSEEVLAIAKALDKLQGLLIRDKV